MTLHIIIDGYNLVHQSDSPGRLHPEDLQSGREALLDSLAAYKRIKGHRITVIFDGKNAPDLSPQRDRIKGIAIRFSRGGESADTVIKRMAAKEREKALVVSSDRDVADYSAVRGAATISASGFAEKMAIAAYADLTGATGEDDGGWIPTTKKKGPGRRRPKRERRNRSMIKKL